MVNEKRIAYIGPPGYSLSQLTNEEIKLIEEAKPTKVGEYKITNIERDDPKYWDLTKKEKNANIVPVRTEPKIGRNEKCPCGSDKKYKNCCLILEVYKHK